MRIPASLLCVLVLGCAPAPDVDRQQQPISSAIIAYHNGALIQNVRVAVLYWNSTVGYQTYLNQFYGDIVKSPYLDWFGTYSAGGYTIGRGTYWGSYVDNQTSTSVTSDDVENEILAQIAAGHLPPGDSNTLYMVHLPYGTISSYNGTHGCTDYCGIHLFSRMGPFLPYAIVQEAGASCSGCYAGSDVTIAASHELAEAITDPFQSGWFRDTDGHEAADLCRGWSPYPQVDNYVVAPTEDLVNEGCGPSGVLCSSGPSCNNRCVDYQNDPLNCGVCQHGCLSGQNCVSGGCVWITNNPCRFVTTANNGWYCGSSTQSSFDPTEADSHTLYHCLNQAVSQTSSCGSNACVVANPGVSDFCPSACTCYEGNGIYCGAGVLSYSASHSSCYAQSGVPINSKNLYHCSSGTWTVQQTCTNGCVVAPQGTADYCASTCGAPNLVCGSSCCQAGNFCGTNGVCCDGTCKPGCAC